MTGIFVREQCPFAAYSTYISFWYVKPRLHDRIRDTACCCPTVVRSQWRTPSVDRCPVLSWISFSGTPAWYIIEVCHAHLVLVTVFFGTNFVPSACSFVSSTNKNKTKNKLPAILLVFLLAYTKLHLLPRRLALCRTVVLTGLGPLPHPQTKPFVASSGGSPVETAISQLPASPLQLDQHAALR